MNLQALIANLFIGGVGLSISALCTWLVYLTLLVFDVDKEQALQGKEDVIIRKEIKNNKDEIELLKDKIESPK